MATVASTDRSPVRVRSGNASLYTEVCGDGPPLLLVHGWALDHRVFETQMSGLAGQFRVIVFDRRGFGSSEAEPDMRRELEDIDAIIDQLAGGPVHLLGMSQGGRVALRYAATRPEHLRSLILQGAAIDGEEVEAPEEERIPLAEYVELARSGRMEEFRRRWLEHPMMALGEGQREAADLLATILTDYRGEDLIHFRPEAYAFPLDVLQEIAEKAPPTLLLTGAKETVARREQARRLAETIPGAKEVVLRNGGHLCNVTEADAYNRAVSRFCRAVDRQR